MPFQEYANWRRTSSGLVCPATLSLYAATKTLGVYLVADFDPTSLDQPVWAACNSGLGATDAERFGVDPFHKADRQYVLIGSEGTLYRRDSGGAWAAILTPAILHTLFGQNDNAVKAFWSDQSIDGRLWAAVKINTNTSIACFSDDHGDTWSAYGQNSWWGGGHIEGIFAYGNSIWVRDAGGTGDGTYIEYSADKGGSWNYWGTDLVEYSCAGAFNPLEPTRFYYGTNGPTLNYFDGANLHVLHTVVNLDVYTNLWFHLTDPLYQRNITNSRLYVTTDGWTTINTPDVITPGPGIIAPNDGAGMNNIIVSINDSGHFLGILDGESDTTVRGLGGTNRNTPPYTDSIPVTCGGICKDGIRLIVV